MSRMNARWPLREQLRDPVDDAAIDRWWRAIELRQPTPSRPTQWAIWVFAAAAAVVVLGLFGAHLRGAFGSPVLLTDNGRAFVGLVAPASKTVRQRFADGSTIDAEPNTTLQGLASTPQEFSVLLERGSIDVAVTPGGPRRWTIEAKLARVEVVGTKFHVTRHGDDEVVVAVTEGVVLVRSVLLEQGVIRLSAGKVLRILPRSPKAQSSEQVEIAPDSVSTESPAPPVMPSAVSVKAGTSTLAPVPRETAVTLIQKADAARLSGDVAKAERLLERLVREFPTEPQASFAAYSLGVVRLQSGKPTQAIDALMLALALQPSSSLQQDCYLRLIESELSAGQRERANDTEREYLKRFPTGRHRRAIGSLIGTAGGGSAL